MDGPDWLDLQLTWQGHDFLNTLRDPTVWERALRVPLRRREARAFKSS